VFTSYMGPYIELIIVQKIPTSSIHEQLRPPGFVHLLVVRAATETTFLRYVVNLISDPSRPQASGPKLKHSTSPCHLRGHLALVSA
jgi:hypothetical protein